ncbi:uncharacterized protein LOC132269989 [Cornus florida]|uniref:uncharacterized protein LOC132269989 n=1 Tax=Cornus florida TaxID=4283 RepID=UPI00289E0922|nr:uncharacterized protein LOC132269989 [Cornus florida]
MSGGGGGRRKIPTSNGRKDRDEDLLLFREMHKREKDRVVSLLQPVSDDFESNGNSEATMASSGRPKSPNPNPNPKPKPKVPPKSVTPSGRPTNISSQNTKFKPLPNQKMNQSTTDLMKKPNVILTTTPKPTKQRESNPNFLTSNLSKSIGTDSKSKPKSRGVSPLVRSTIPAQIPGFSDQTPTNLRTDRASSATRGRPGNQAMPIVWKPEPITNPRRQSCSPSVTRGRRVEQKQESEGNVSAQKESRVQAAGSGTQVLGSRMLDKFMNARKLSAEDRETKPKLNGSVNESSGFGRMMSKSSLDMALKHMDIKREPIIYRQAGTRSTYGKGSVTIENAK